MTTIHIPPAALEAGARAILKEWTDLNSAEAAARAAFVAMVSNWPGMAENALQAAFLVREPALILPLMENPDDKA